MALVYRVEARISEVIPVGLVPEGVRLDAHFSGRVVEGPLSGATMRGVDYLLLRADGIGVIDAYEVVSTEAGAHVSAHAQGYVTPPPGVQLPPPEVMLSPGFEWPDLPLPMHGFVLYRTGAEDLSWMNRTSLGFEGTVNVGTGELIIEARAMHTGAAEGAGLTVH